MKPKLLIGLIGLLVACNLPNKKPAKEKGERIVIEIKMPGYVRAEDKYIRTLPLAYQPEVIWKEREPFIERGIAKFVFHSDEPLLVDLSRILGEGNMSHIYEPGDSIYIQVNDQIPIYTGKNADKFNIFQTILSQEKKMTLPANKEFEKANSVNDYLSWSQYINERENIADSIIDVNKQKLSPTAYEFIRSDKLANNEYMRLMKFGALYIYMTYYKYPQEQICAIFDSTTTNKHTKWLHAYTGRVINDYYFYDFVRKSVQRKYNFALEQDTMQGEIRKAIYMDYANKLYNGEVRQACLVFLLTNQGLKEHSLKGPAPVIDSMLNVFYSETSYPAYKLYVRAYEKKVAGWIEAKEKNKGKTAAR